MAIVAFAGGASLSAQAGVAITGRVLDDATDSPIAGAGIELIGPAGQTVRRAESDDHGNFLLLVRSGGTYRLRATRLGHAESLSAPVRIEPGDTLRVILRMDIQAIELPALEVVARSRAHSVARLEGFHYRAERGFGSFILREEIERRRPLYISALLVEHGITVEASGRGRTVGLLSRRYHCAPLVYIDGFLAVPVFEGRTSREAIAEAGRAVNMIHPLDVEGIEIYRGPSTVPGEFGGSNARCGVIVIWTRSGSE